MSSAFPASKYSRYKRATAFFLDWLLRARGRGRHTGSRIQLQQLSGLVEEIAAEPSSLSPQLLCQLPKALAACQCAITLRDHVAAYFGEDADEGHQHFLGLLRRWLDALKSVEVEQQEAPLESQRTTFESYYDVLQLDEDFFPDEERGFEAAGVPRRAKADRKKLLEEAFAEDLRLELVCYFLELEELVDGVFDVYDQVKKQKRTLVEATVVAKVAMDTVSSLTAQLQLKYPALKTAEDVIMLLRCQIPAKVMERIRRGVGIARQKVEDGKTYTSVPGMLLVEFSSVVGTLKLFAVGIEKSFGCEAVFVGKTVELYGEERTPEYVLPDPSCNEHIFLSQHLPMLYNCIASKRIITGSGYGGTSGLADAFMASMEKFFETHTMTVSLVFTCICWIRAVAALQGDLGLGRNVSLTYNHQADLMRILEANVENNAWLTEDVGAREHVRRFVDKLKKRNHGYCISRRNPLLAGFVLLDNDLVFLKISHQVGRVSWILRAFGHLYNALVNEGFLENIPFFDEVLTVYEQVIFVPSQAAATRGSYNRTYLLSCDWTPAAIRAKYQGTSRRSADLYKMSKKFRLDNVSKICSLLGKDGKLFMKSSSSKTMLSNVADVCSKELFQTRVLSRDMLTLNGDLTETFHAIYAALGALSHDDHDAENMDHSGPEAFPRALGDVMRILPILDALQPDGIMMLSALPVDIRGNNLRGQHVREICRQASAVIKTKFVSSPRFCEEKYFTYPAQPDFVRQAFGSASLKRCAENENTENVFWELMNLLRTSNGPLCESDLDHLQAEIKKFPGLLSMMMTRLESYEMGSPDDELCTLFHQAAAGPAHDLYLVEWMIQMGALVNQPLHYRKKSGLLEVKHDGVIISNTMAVHSAAIAGLEDIVRIILEADNMKDLNTPTLHTNETLAHLAAKHGHQSLYDLLDRFGADLSVRNSNGELVYDVTTDQEWRREIVANIVKKKKKLAFGEESHRNSMLQYKGHLPVEVEQLRKSVLAQQDEECRSALAKTETKTKLLKKAISASTAPPLSSTSDAASSKLSGQMKQVLLSPTPETEEKPTENLSKRIADLHRWFDTATTFIARQSSEDTVTGFNADDVESARAMIIELESIVRFLSHPTRLNSTYPWARVFVATNAFKIIHMMQKLHRVTQPALTVPLLGPVKELCDTTLDFTEFVVGTAQLLASFSRNSQAREILDVLEKRLLKTPFDKRKPTEFRALVQMYSSARDTMGMGSTSSSKTFRALEWYLTNTVGNTELQDKLDGMIGHPVYFDLTPTAETTNQQFDEFKSAIEGIPELSGVVCLTREGKRVMYGGSNKMDVKRVRGSVMAAAEGVGVRFGGEGSQDFTSAVSVGEFVISIGGASRNAVAA